MRAEEDDPGDESGEGHEEDARPDQHAGDDGLGDEEPAAGHGPHQQIAQVAPGGVAGDGVAGERARDDDEQEAAHRAQHGGGDEQAALLRQAEQALAVVAVAAAARGR